MNRVLHSRFPPFGFVLKPVRSVHMSFNMIMAESCEESFFQRSMSRDHAHRVLHSRFPPFGFVLKPFWSIHMCFNIVMADSCQKSFFKTSISRNHAYRVLHSRFPPFGFVLKPVCSNNHVSQGPRLALGASPPRGGLEGNFYTTCFPDSSGEEALPKGAWMLKQG